MPSYGKRFYFSAIEEADYNEKGEDYDNGVAINFCSKEFLQHHQNSKQDIARDTDAFHDQALYKVVPGIESKSFNGLFVFFAQCNKDGVNLCVDFIYRQIR